MQDGVRKQGLVWRAEPCMLAATALYCEVDVFKDDRWGRESERGPFTVT